MLLQKSFAGDAARSRLRQLILGGERVSGEIGRRRGHSVAPSAAAPRAEHCHGVSTHSLRLSEQCRGCGEFKVFFTQQGVCGGYGYSGPGSVER